MNDNSNYAEATVTVRVKNLGSWGDGCTAGQIREQAVRAALLKIHKLLEGEDFEIVGEPDIAMIMI